MQGLGRTGDQQDVCGRWSHVRRWILKVLALHLRIFFPDALSPKDYGCGPSGLWIEAGPQLPACLLLQKLGSTCETGAEEGPTSPFAFG